MAVRRPERRSLFHSSSGGIDLSRLIEQSIPAVVIGCVVVFANFKVMEGQVADIRKELDTAKSLEVIRAQQLQAQSEKLAGITAQITTFLGQQVNLNTTMDARITYIERARVR